MELELYKKYMDVEANLVLRMVGYKEIEWVEYRGDWAAVCMLTANQVYEVVNLPNAPNVWLFDNTTDTDSLVLSVEKSEAYKKCYSIQLDDGTRHIMPGKVDMQYMVELFPDEH